jgi:hypothetical protein
MRAEPIAVRVTNDQVAWAASVEERIRASGLYETPNPTGLCADGRWEKGFLGEIALDNLLRETELWYRWDPQTDGRPDRGYDFTFCDANGEEVLLDVKCAGEAHHRNLLLNQHHAVAPKSRVFVGAKRVERNVVEVWGWCSRAEILAAPINRTLTSPAHQRALDTLRPLRELFDHLVRRDE